MKIIAENEIEQRLVDRINEIGKNLSTQDNRHTCWPIWTILEKNKITTGYGAGMFLTQAEAEDHIANNDYHYAHPQLYVASAHRNYELHDIIHFILLSTGNKINSNHYGNLE